MNAVTVHNKVDAMLFSRPMMETKELILRSIDSIDDSQVMTEILLAVNKIMDKTEKRKNSGKRSWESYAISDETMNLTLQHRLEIPDNYDMLLKNKLKREYL